MICGSCPDIAQLSNEDALGVIGQLIDQALDVKDSSSTSHAFTLLDLIKMRELTPVQTILVHYFRANAWENRIHEAGNVQSWKWEQPELQNQILELRRAVSHPNFPDLDLIRQCQILTNLANTLNSVGRFIEAIDLWDRVIAKDEQFAMAHGNRGNGLCAYANALYDSGHSHVIWLAAIDAFEAASSEDAHFDNVQNENYRQHFADLRAEAATNFDLPAVRKLYESGYKDTKLGRSKMEREYRLWVLGKRLFLNPLNDLGGNPIASHDVLTLPSITIPFDRSSSASPPAVISMYNQLKQEFVSARFMFFEGMREEKPHFSDKGVLLYNTMNYPSYSLAAEKMRASYRLAYSLFDKIAYFLNHYLGIGHPDNQVKFRDIWYERKGANPKQLLAAFDERQNWPLRGLFWLSKDLFEPDFKEATEPQAEALSEIRHHLEHKFFQLHESWAVAGMDEELWKPKFGFHTSRTDFEDKTLHVLKLARAALIYLSLAVHREEQVQFPDASEGLDFSLPLDVWEDEWKM